MNSIKCENCHQWTDNDRKYCLYCGHEHHKKIRQEKEVLKKPLDTGFPFIKIKKGDAFYLKAGKAVILFFQVILYGIISLIMYIASSVVH